MPRIEADYSPDRNLSRYLREIRTIPLLEETEESQLAWRLREADDRAAAERLVTSHLRLVPKIASGYRGYGLPYADLIAAGNVGIVQAVERFDPSRGIRLSTYAIWWIRAAIQEFVLRSWSMVKMATTAAQKKLFFNLRRIKAELGLIGEGDLPEDGVDEICRRLDVPRGAVVSMNRRLIGPDMTLDAPIGEDTEEVWLDRIADPADDQETRLGDSEDMSRRRALLETALAQLPPRERRILVARRLTDPPVKLKTLAGEFGVSRERIRQLEVQALARVKANVRRAEAGRMLAASQIELQPVS